MSAGIAQRLKISNMMRKATRGANKQESFHPLIQNTLRVFHFNFHIVSIFIRRAFCFPSLYYQIIFIHSPKQTSPGTGFLVCTEHN
jgi:hypothetical protein